MRLKITGMMIIVVAALCLGAVHERALAYPPCGPYQEPLTNAYGSFCRPQYFGYELVRLADYIPFAWIRSEPASDAPILTTIYPTSYASMKLIYADDRYTAWDGYQNWYQVHPYPLDTGIIGWVEQASITTAAYNGYPPENPAEQAQWTVPQTGYVKPGVPFLWIRSAAGSEAGIVATIPANAELTIVGSPLFDGVQWWWTVEYSTRSGTKSGYVEQSLIIASNGPIMGLN